MLLDAPTLPADAPLAGEVCVIGAGAAGITLALTLAAAGRDVLLLEAGGLEPEESTQELHAVVNRRPQYPFDRMRLRYFGGTTNHWGGQCRPLDEHDFQVRPWVPNSGWPITRADLLPYYPAAARLLDILPEHVGKGLDDVTGDLPAAPSFVDGFDELATLVWLQSPPTRMNKRYQQAILESPRIRCCLHANVTELRVDEAGRRVTSAVVRTLSGRTLTATAPVFVVCTGGIENARLLLASDRQIPGGIGNAHDLVGRFFMEHVGLSGRLVVRRPVAAADFREEAFLRRGVTEFLRGVKTDFVSLAPTPAAQAAHRLLACCFNWEWPPLPGDDAAAAATAFWGDGTDGTAYRLVAISEPTPQRDSRIILDEGRDALGQRRAAVDLRIHPGDRERVRSAFRFLGRTVGAAERGRVQRAEDAELASGGGHDIGATRMGRTPAEGVTDGHGRVHGMDNLFMAGNSLFPTAGVANPTLTCVALALRLADHLSAASPPVVPTAH